MRPATMLRRRFGGSTRVWSRVVKAPGIDAMGFLIALALCLLMGPRAVDASMSDRFTDGFVATTSSGLRALHDGSHSNIGDIHKIAYASSTHNPTAAFTLSPRNGLLPLKVSFNASGSKPYTGRKIVSYTWDFGDGSPKTTGVKVSHTFTKANLRTVKLTVVDSAGSAGTVTHTVDAGNSAPTPSISSPSSSFLFSKGTQITLTGSASDREEGTLSSTHLSWDVVYNHGGVATTLLHASGNNLNVTAPQPVDIVSASGSTITISLTATDGHGLHKTVITTIKPKLVRLSFVTDPAGANFRAGELTFAGPNSIRTWANAAVEVDAIGGIAANGQPLGFVSWSDGGASRHVITAPSSSTTYSASFTVANSSPYTPAADATVRDSAPNTNFGGTTVLSARSSSPKERVYLRFNVAGVSGTVTSATLYLYALTNSVNVPTIYKTSNDWTELGLTWSNRPAPDGGSLPGASRVGANSWVAFDVTGSVTANGTVSFVIQRDSQTTAQFVSREGGANAPRLIIASTTDGASASVNPPSGLNGAAFSSSVIDLSWTAPDGNVTGYDIERDGVLVTTIGPGTAYRDEFRRASSTFSYRLRTRTSSGASAWSNSVQISTPATTSDTSVSPQNTGAVSEDGTFPTSCNASTRAPVRGGAGHQIETFIRFKYTPPSGPVYNAELRLYVTSTSPSGAPASIAVYGSSGQNQGSSWSSRAGRHPVDSPYDSVANPRSGGWITLSVNAGSYASGAAAFVLASDDDALVCISNSGSTAPRLVLISLLGPASAAKAPAAAVEASSTPSDSTGESSSTATSTPSLPISDDFENGLAAWPVIDGLTVASDLSDGGASAARSAGSGAGDAPGKPSYADRPIGEARSELWAAVDVNVVQTPTEQVTLLSALDGNGEVIASVSLDRESELLLSESIGGGGVKIDAAPASQWFRIEIHVRLDGGEPVIEVWLNGVFAKSLALPVSDRKIEAIRLGNASTSAIYDVAYDNFIVSASCSGDCPTPSVTPTAQPEETPEETVTATPTATPNEPAPTVAPTETATPEPTPTETPEPAIEPEAPTQTPTVEPPPDGSPPADETG